MTERPHLPVTAAPQTAAPQTAAPQTAAPQTAAPQPSTESSTLWAAVGGTSTFERLVAEFYRGVADDALLRPMYPEEDLGPAARRLQLFLEQYWGGPSTYGAERGHPRLRIRHEPFPVTVTARDAWLAHMRRALDSVELAPEHEAAMWDHFMRAAFMLVNTDE